MSYDERRLSNVAQKLENELLDKTLRRGLSLLPAEENQGVTIASPGNQSKFTFFPVIPDFQGGTTGNTGVGGALERVQQVFNLLQQLPLTLEVPPSSVNYSFRKKKTTAQTLSGFVEYHWGEEVDSINANGSTGAFLNQDTGLADGPDRRASYSYVNYENLLRLYKNNGAVYDSFGKVMLFYGIFLYNDVGIFQGYFEKLDVTENANSPYNFKLSWDFKVKRIIHLIIN